MNVLNIAKTTRKITRRSKTRFQKVTSSFNFQRLRLISIIEHPILLLYFASIPPRSPIISMTRRPSQPLKKRVCNLDQLQRVVIENSHGENLKGILHETGSKELVLVCHGFRSRKERLPMVTLAAAVEREGISAFRFDFAGNGESEGSFQYGNYHRETEDLRFVVQHFREKKRVISALIGHSKGGNVVLLYTSKYKDVPTVVNMTGRFNLKRGMEGRLGKNFLQVITQNGYLDVTNREGKFKYRVTEESLKDRLSTDMRSACLLIPQECRVLTVHGSKDFVPVEDAVEFSKLIPNHKLHIIETADHEYTEHQEELTSVVLEFLRKDSYFRKDTHNSPSVDHPFRSRL